ncbi:MAG: DUF998 domain-containing protein [Phormidesmis sp.]
MERTETNPQQTERAQDNNGPNKRLVLSYLMLRKSIGTLGILLPLVLVLGGGLLFGLGIQDTVSDYYHTGMRDVFVGTLCAMGVFLFSYNGYGRKDNRAGNLASIFVIGTALIPTTPVDPSPLAATLGKIHILCATSYFLTLAYFSLFLFTKSHPTQPPSPQKRMRNRVYRVCGYTILGAIAAIGIYIFLIPENIQNLLEPGIDVVFWLEAIAVIAFGISWFVKGEGLLKDKP